MMDVRGPQICVALIGGIGRMEKHYLNEARDPSRPSGEDGNLAGIQVEENAVPLLRNLFAAGMHGLSERPHPWQAEEGRVERETGHTKKIKILLDKKI